MWLDSKVTPHGRGHNPILAIRLHPTPFRLFSLLQFSDWQRQQTQRIQ